MSCLEVRWTKRAARRLEQIGAHIAKHSPDSAARVIARSAAAVGALAERPAMGRPGRLEGTRELVLADIPYIIPYRVTQTSIDVLTVMHAAQEWPSNLS
ncbi:type II toxin-antitoxin system RelE/ParE family toxin [Rhodoblastus acidophilus]|uniref:Type II toxin-antitoxin system RelE/ParE family toxin n=1 Tax=Rhodoblastus acidophilus TaxID=1074 RepID=A0A6N8DIK0_RHOAC|nr:type II toxin-antitoxin system RelE/ParE family toxin [Rhodoblastus acidophilus]MCW2272685.1 plasmid stabilization system protein ParE [Rhodoblastus acidophilus]MTV29596.1 type II toxin-antitoxin system RelE/ParE family toxin [Rhodoblastus acidophilus]